MAVLSSAITDASTNIFENRKPEPATENSVLNLDHLKGNFPLKCVSIYSVDVKLKKRINEFKSLESWSTALKVLAAALFILVPVAYLLWKKARSYDQAKIGLIDDMIEQSSKDANRKVLVTLNGTQHDTPQSLINALDQAGLSDLQKYTTLQLAHQAVYATLLHASLNDLLGFANAHAPLIQEDDQPLSTDRNGTPAPYNPIVKDISNGGQGKMIRMKIENGVALLSTEIRLGASVYDQTAQGAYRNRVILEFDTAFTIDLNDGMMSIQHRLDKINPLTGPIPLYYGERGSVSSDDGAPSSTDHSVAERSADTPSPPACDSSILT